MLFIHNTLSRRKEEFHPLKEGEIGIYVCGVTVYDYCHIGHARTFVNFDMIVRYLRYRGYKVKYVRNITDIDDKIIARANKNGETVQALSSRFIDYMHEDFAKLLRQAMEQDMSEYVSWRLYDDNGKTKWKTNRDGKEIIATHSPDTTLLKRFTTFLLKVIPEKLI